VVTPYFNQGSYIQETIEILLSQDYSRIEYLIMEEGSYDRSLEVVKSNGASSLGFGKMIGTKWLRTHFKIQSLRGPK
jgi:glycosyltransferase involved in cell wall biosynthesis